MRPLAASTAGSCMALIDNAAQAPGGAIDETIARMAVAPYSMNRGRFVPEPLLKWQLTVTGGRLDDGTGTVTEAASPDAVWWDPADAGPSWPSLDGDYTMVTPPDSIVEAMPASVADRRCGLLLPALRLEPGGAYTFLCQQSTMTWFAVAARPLLGADGAQRCRLASMELATRVGPVQVHAELDGGTMYLRSDTIEYVSLPVGAAEATPLVCSIGLNAGVIEVHLADQLGVRMESAAVAAESPAVASFTLGGLSSGGLIAYGAAYSPDSTGSAESAVRLLGDVVSC